MGRLKLLRFGFGAPQLFLTEQVDLRTHGDGFQNSLRNIASHNGLAYLVSPQVGKFYQTLVMLKYPYLKEQQWSGYKNLKNSHFRALMNLVVDDKSTKEKEVWEQCVGYPGLRLRMLRSEKIKIKYRNEKKYDDIEEQASGFQAIVMQQAADHLQAKDPLMLATGIDIKDPKLKQQHGDVIQGLFAKFLSKRQNDMREQGEKWSPFRRTVEFNRLRRELMYSIMES